MVRKQFKLLFGPIIIAALASCDVHSDIASISGGQYMLTETDMKVGVGGVRASVVNSVHDRANSFCSTHGGHADKISDTFENASLGRFATYTLIFRCAS
jgi:hypothetical protein